MYPMFRSVETMATVLHRWDLWMRRGTILEKMPPLQDIRMKRGLQCFTPVKALATKGGLLYDCPRAMALVRLSNFSFIFVSTERPAVKVPKGSLGRKGAGVSERD